MSDEVYQNSELDRKLAKTLHEIKEDIQTYLKQNFPENGSTRVFFTIKDRHIQDEPYLAWRYWIGLDKEDLNNFGGEELKNKAYAFLGHGDDTFKDNYQPCTFEQGVSVSGLVKPGRNWMFLQIPDNLKSLEDFKIPAQLPNSTDQDFFDKTMMKPFFHHSKFSEKEAEKIIGIFFDNIFDEKGTLKQEYTHKKQKEERKKKLNDFDDAVKQAFKNFNKDSINNFSEEEAKKIIRGFFDIIFEEKKQELKQEYTHKKQKEEREKKLKDFDGAAEQAFKNFCEDSINNFSEEEAKKIIRGFFDIIFEEEKLKQEYTYIKQKEERINNFSNNKPADGKYFRYLMRAIDYYFLFQGYKYMISYGLLVGGYHLLTFYILIKTEQKIEKEISPEKKWELAKRNNYGEEWVSIDGAFDMWRVAGCPKFKSTWTDFNDFTNFLGEIDSIIKIGWTNTINTVLNEIGNEAALRGEDIAKVIEKCISYVLFLDNPQIDDDRSTPKYCIDENMEDNEKIVSCSLCQKCVHEDLKFIVKAGDETDTAGKCNYEHNKNCIHISEQTNQNKIEVVFRNFNEKGDRASAKVTLKRLVRTFATQYENVIVPTRKNILKSAVISIIIDSYAHNISAHSLAALKWWFELRSKLLERRIYCGDNEKIELTPFSPSKIEITKEDREIAEKYYSALNLKDSTYNFEYYSLFDYLQFSKDDKRLFLFLKKVSPKLGAKEAEYFYPRFPVPIDYAIFPFMRFLRDKGAFWSGVTRDMTFGGESKTLYQILWEDFANNPLYLGTIAFSEGITKMNIHVVFENKDGVIIKDKGGEFVSIDLSVIEFESQLANPFEEKNKENTYDSNSNVNNTDHRTSPIKYSQYGFVRLGNKFSELRGILSKDEYTIFLPGGIIGEHALFTIIENTIRNIKHYKDLLEDIKNKGINLFISIREDDVTSDKAPRFKIGIWLDHDTNLDTKTIDDTGKILNKKIIDLMKEKANASIVDELGVPRMGGNSQDKACAALLFNNTFLSVESNETVLQSKYYPWIEFKEETDQNKDRKGKIKKYFTVWKSENVYRYDGKEIADLKDRLENENISRFKFFVSEDNLTEEMKALLREKGIIRILESCKEKEKISEIYKEWLKYWIPTLKFENDTPLIIFRSGDIKGRGQIKGVVWIKDNTLIYNWSSSFPFDKFDDNNIEIAHGNEKSFHCNVRAHGKFFQKFFAVKEIGELSDLRINVDEQGNLLDHTDEKLLLEFIEIVKTKIIVFDDRVYQRFSVYNEEKKKMFEEQLFLEVYPEDKSKFKNDWTLPNILIIHLSFIERLEDDKGRHYSEERIVDFINNEILNKGENNGSLPGNFILVITSGRGRGDWNRIIRENYSYSKNTIFKSIETILSAVEAGISYNDHFDVKYNLVKSIMGS